MFGKRAGEGAAAYAQKLSGAPSINLDEADASSADMLGHFERRDGKENPYAIQHDLQETMHALVGIIRTQSELEEAVVRFAELQERARRQSSKATASTTRAGTWRWTCVRC